MAVEQDDVVGVLRLAGELDTYSRASLADAARQLMDARMIRRIEIDAGGVSFLDSAGLSELLSVKRIAEALGLEVRLVDASRPVRRVLAITGLAGLFSS